MYLFFDTETTGLPKNWKAPLSDLNNWPRLVQLAWLQYDDYENIISKESVIIKPDNFTIPANTTNVHGISTEKAMNEGINLKQALLHFNEAIDFSSVLVAHNISFDEKIIGAEYLRCKMQNNLIGINKICTKEKSTQYCAIPHSNNFGYKWPSLMELHEILFNESFDNAHDALIDVKACAKCFFELKRRKVILL